MTFNQTKVNGVAMPLLMGCTRPSTIDIEEEDITLTYDPFLQIRNIECGRTVGTRSLRTRATEKKITQSLKQVLSDKKNEIDDSKYV